MICRVCGCGEDTPCIVDGEPCHWAEPDLCSACADETGVSDELLVEVAERTEIDARAQRGAHRRGRWTL